MLRFFHAYASSRHRMNSVQSLAIQTQTVTDPIQMRNRFVEHMQGLLGTQTQVESFDPSVLYENDLDMRALQEPFTDQEIEQTVKHLANNRASGPDGLQVNLRRCIGQKLKEW